MILQNMHMGVPDWEKPLVVSSLAVFCTDRGLIAGFLHRKRKRRREKKKKSWPVGCLSTFDRGVKILSSVCLSQRSYLLLLARHIFGHAKSELTTLLASKFVHLSCIGTHNAGCGGQW